MRHWVPLAPALLSQVAFPESFPIPVLVSCSQSDHVTSVPETVPNDTSYEGEIILRIPFYCLKFPCMDDKLSVSLIIAFMTKYGISFFVCYFYFVRPWAPWEQAECSMHLSVPTFLHEAGHTSMQSGFSNYQNIFLKFSTKMHVPQFLPDLVFWFKICLSRQNMPSLTKYPTKVFHMS